MLFMVMTSYEPEKRDEVTKRLLDIEGKHPEGMKVIGQWSAIGGGRGFTLAEVDDPKVGLIAAMAWSDLLKFEIVPVIETEEVRKLMQGR
jgi:hypothetical protein